MPINLKLSKISDYILSHICRWQNNIYDDIKNMKFYEKNHVKMHTFCIWSTRNIMLHLYIFDKNIKYGSLYEKQKFFLNK